MPAEKNYLIDHRRLDGLSDDDLMAKYKVVDEHRRSLESQSNDAYRAAVLSDNMLADLPKLVAVSSAYEAVMQLRLFLWVEAHRRDITHRLSKIGGE